MIRLTTQLGLVLCTIAGTALADTYRWVDDNGVVNFAEQKPRGVPEERITRIAGSERPRSGRTQVAATPAPRTQPPAARPAPDSGASRLSEAQQEMLRNLEAAEAERQNQVAQIREDNCTRSREMLDNLTVRDRIRVRAEDGSIRVLPEEERQQRIADAQRGVVENCGS